MIQDNIVNNQDQNQLHENLNPPPMSTNTDNQQQPSSSNENYQGDVLIVPVFLHPGQQNYNNGYYPYISPAMIPITPIDKLLYQAALVKCPYCNKEGITTTNAECECHWCLLACITGFIPWCIYSIIKKGDCTCMKATHKCRHCDVVLKELKNC